MAETKPIPVRLDEKTTGRLDAAAGRIGNNRAGLIRLLLGTWLDDFEKRGTASLPPNWEEIIAGTDNRTKESRERYPAPPPAAVIAETPNSKTTALRAGGVMADRIRAKREKS